MSKYAYCRRYIDTDIDRYARKLWQGNQESQASPDSTESFTPAQDKKQVSQRKKEKEKVNTLLNVLPCNCDIH